MKKPILYRGYRIFARPVDPRDTSSTPWGFVSIDGERTGGQHTVEECKREIDLWEHYHEQRSREGDTPAMPQMSEEEIAAHKAEIRAIERRHPHLRETRIREALARRSKSVRHDR